MATHKYSFIPLVTFMLYSSSSLLLVLFISCSPQKSQALGSHCYTLGAASNSPSTDCKHYNETLLNLDWLRDSLARQEDTIIFSLIERSKYANNSRLYNDEALSIPYASSLFGFFVKNSEAVQAQAGRYASEEEISFSSSLPSPIVKLCQCPPVLHPSGAHININKNIWNMYLKKLLPQIAANESDDGKYAPTAASDLDCLQAISRRIHYGKFVAEAKFLKERKKYSRAIRAKNITALASFLTNVTVENAVKERVEKKAKKFGENVNNTYPPYKVDPSAVSKLYGDWVIPLTKIVEIKYLLTRLT